MSFIVKKGIFVSKQSRPDIQPPIGVLCTRVKAPNVSYWKKLIRLLKCLNSTRDDVLTLGADDLYVIKWYIDAVFAVHPGIKSYAGSTMISAMEPCNPYLGSRSSVLVVVLKLS